MMSGEGYSLMWPEGQRAASATSGRRARSSPRPTCGSTSTSTPAPTPARYLAFKQEGVAIRNAQGVPKAWISKRVGGDQIDYADESAEVRQWFAEALSRHGLSSRMEEAYKAELADLPPKVPQAA